MNDIQIPDLTMCGLPWLNDERTDTEYLVLEKEFSWNNAPKTLHKINLYFDFHTEKSRPEDFDGFALTANDDYDHYVIGYFKSHRDAIYYWQDNIDKICRNTIHGKPSYGFTLEAFKFKEEDE